LWDLVRPPPNPLSPALFSFFLVNRDLSIRVQGFGRGIESPTKATHSHLVARNPRATAPNRVQRTPSGPEGGGAARTSLPFAPARAAGASEPSLNLPPSPRGDRESCPPPFFASSKVGHIGTVPCREWLPSDLRGGLIPLGPARGGSPAPWVRAYFLGVVAPARGVGDPVRRSRRRRSHLGRSEQASARI